MAKRNTQSDKPVERLCLVCDTIVTSTRKDFIALGHTDDLDHAKSMYGMSSAESRRVLHRARSMGRIHG